MPGTKKRGEKPARETSIYLVIMDADTGTDMTLKSFMGEAAAMVTRNITATLAVAETAILEIVAASPTKVEATVIITSIKVAHQVL